VDELDESLYVTILKIVQQPRVLFSILYASVKQQAGSEHEQCVIDTNVHKECRHCSGVRLGCVQLAMVQYRAESAASSGLTVQARYTVYYRRIRRRTDMIHRM
jgi:hypothetical protein